MHLALKAYQELLLTVNEMDRSQDESIRQSSSVIKSKFQTAILSLNGSLFSKLNWNTNEHNSLLLYKGLSI